MKEIVSSPDLVAACGLYCGACGGYRRDKCPGCHEAKRRWCKVLACCREHGYRTCAECKEFSDPNACARFNNFVSRFFSFLFRADRAACIARIRELGLPGYAEEMAKAGRQCIRRGATRCQGG